MFKINKTNIKKISLRRVYYQFRHKFLTFNNIVLIIGLFITIGWISGSLEVMQRNYTLQRELENKSRQLILAELDTYSAELEQRYYQTEEYKELAVRQRLGLGSPGESVLILSKDNIEDSEETTTDTDFIQIVEPSNFKQWLDFLYGNNIKNISQ
jgi:hypothetical protein